MDYVELNLPVSDQQQAEIITAWLSDFPFESFMQESGVLKAYITKDALCDCKDDIDHVLAGAGCSEHTYIEIESRNWNELWESQFEPVDVEGLCTIRAPFSPPPASGLDIVIMPKMSFGTGHHATTWLMTSELFRHDFSGLAGLDMGSGTGVLAIVAVHRGARHVDAVDIDQWAFENSVENIRDNGVSDKITPVLGDASVIAGKHYDFVLANINRNILLSDMPRYAAALSDGGLLVMSGILEKDIDAISRKACELGFDIISSRIRDGWAVVTCRLRNS